MNCQDHCISWGVGNHPTIFCHFRSQKSRIFNILDFWLLKLQNNNSQDFRNSAYEEKQFFKFSWLVSFFFCTYLSLFYIVSQIYLAYKCLQLISTAPPLAFFRVKVRFISFPSLPMFWKLTTINSSVIYSVYIQWNPVGYNTVLMMFLKAERNLNSVKYCHL